MKRSLHLFLFPLFLLTAILELESQSCPPEGIDLIEPIFAQCDPTFTAELPSTGVFEFASGMFASAVDDCTTTEDLNYTFNPSQVTCADIGSSIQVTTFVFDASGNMNQCQTLVFVEDNLPPIIACQSSVIVSLDQNGSIALNAEMLGIVVDENCNLSYNIIPSLFDCSDVGTDVWVDVIATDQSGNESICSTLVSIVDRQPPTINCVPNVSINLPESGIVTLEPSLFNVVVNDNCTLPGNIDITINPSSVDCSDVLNPLTVEIVATDQAGNEESCFSTVMVVDITPPEINCRSQINIILPPSGQMNVDPLSVLLSVSDNCTAPGDLNYYLSIPTVDCSFIGDTAVVDLVVSDESGNASTCQFLLIVEDITPPSLFCIDGVAIRLDPDGEFQLSPDLFVSSVSDNCSYDISLSRNVVTCNNAGKMVRMKITVEDNSGNRTRCTSIVEVLDPEPQSVEIEGPSSIECGATEIPFSVNVNGGYGPFIFEWKILSGARRGWEIVSGQGTTDILINAGTKRLSLKVTVTDLCGKRRTDRFTIKCSDSGRNIAQVGVDQSINFPASEVSLYPNPVDDQFIIELPEDIMNSMKEAYVINNNWQLININDFEQRIINRLPISTDHLMKGVYSVIIVTSDKEVVVKRFVKL
ncbi:MAG: T9SS type A sorting domain-containing protein [Saprospiraceae bacterium]|nr:T9SS type A sorting domain-containing protein [Saprospiraceae bacterium]